MTNKVGIDFEAKFNTSGLDKGLNQAASKINQANKSSTYSPVDKDAAQQVDKVTAALQKLLAVDSELRRRLKKTGQAGLPFDQWNMAELYPNATSRRLKEAQIRARLFGDEPGGGGVGGPGGRGILTGMAQAGLRATGSAGGVMASAMGSGAGAGLMGLLGGLGALGVGKIVGGVMENVGKAEENNIALDKLKRTLGDVNVSFNALKTVVRGSADAVKITYGDATGLIQNFVKQGNVGSSQYGSLGSELSLGVGMSRAFGMDPAQGMGFLGSMRGVGMTSNTQESRRIALLIGETIGKSGAFAKVEEVMDAIASYATSQTRQGLGRANVDGFAGMFSAMVGSGIPGLDPSGAGALLSRVNASLSAGGAKGEASQFFTGMVGQSMGLDPLMTRILREGGAFATNTSRFGKGSVYAQYMGKEGPGGDTTFLQATLDRLRAMKLSDNPDDDKKLRAESAAGHLGIGATQAMAMLMIAPNRMGELASKYNLSSLSGDGIANLAKAKYGTAEEVAGLSRSMLNRKDVSEADKASLRGAIGTSNEREILAKLTAQYDQERTTGSDIRDSKAALDNIKTSLADRLVPLMQTMRDGVVMLAGNGKSPREISEEVARLEGKDRLATLPERAASESAASRLRAVQKEKEELNLEFRKQYGKFTNNPEEYYRQLKELNEKEAAATAAATKAKEKYTEALKKADQELKDHVTDIRKGLAPGTTSGLRAQAAATSVVGAGSGFSVQDSVGSSSPGAAPSTGDPNLDAKLAAAEQRNGLPAGTLRAVMRREVGGRQAEFLSNPSKYHYGLNARGQRIAPHTGRVSTAFGPFGILESTGRKPGYGVAPLQSKELDEQIRFAADYLAARSRSEGGLAGGLAAYGEGPGSGYAEGVMKNIPEQVPVVKNSGQSGGSGEPGKAEVTVKVVNEKGQQIAPTQTVQTKVPRARAFGASGSW